MKTRVKLFTLLAVLLTVALITSCGAGGGNYAPGIDEGYNGGSYDKSEGMTDADLSAGNSATGAQKLIVTLHYTLETQDFDGTLTAIERKVGELGGYVVESKIRPAQNEQGSGYATMTVRVPASQEAGMTGLLSSPIGNVTSQSRTAQDVTLSYTDLAARIESLEAQYDRVLALYEEASSLQALMTVEQRLSEISSELTSLKRQMAVMEQQVTYATYYLTVYDVKEYTVPTEEPTYWQTLGESFVDSFTTFADVVGKVAIAVVYVLPYAGVGAVLLAVILLVTRKRNKKYNQKDASSGPKD